MQLSITYGLRCPKIKVTGTGNSDPTEDKSNFKTITAKDITYLKEVTGNCI